MQEEIVFQVSDFVDVFNQTIEYAYPSVVIEGEVANFKVSKGKWVYFDLKDEFSSVKFFGSLYNLPGPIEDGLMVKVLGSPRLHNLFGFSVNFRVISAVGEGSIKKASDLLRAKLEKEGLFEADRKRPLSRYPQRIGLITSLESAAYKDFIKVLDNRWVGLEIEVYNVGVQGLAAVEQNIKAIEYFNNQQTEYDVLVITRGGGSKDDLSVYDDESLVRAVANSKIATMVAVGHEVDISLAELVADKRASTPSNAAELLVPDKRELISDIQLTRKQLDSTLKLQITNKLQELVQIRQGLNQAINSKLASLRAEQDSNRRLLEALDPTNVLRRGFAIVRAGGKVVRGLESLNQQQKIAIELADGEIEATINKINLRKKG